MMAQLKSPTPEDLLGLSELAMIALAARAARRVCFLVENVSIDVRDPEITQLFSDAVTKAEQYAAGPDYSKEKRKTQG